MAFQRCVAHAQCTSIHMSMRMSMHVSFRQFLQPRADSLAVRLVRAGPCRIVVPRGVRELIVEQAVVGRSAGSFLSVSIYRHAYRHALGATHRWKALAEAVILSIGTPICTRAVDRPSAMADVEPI